MSGRRQRVDVLSRVQRIEKKGKKRAAVEEYDLDERAGPVQGVELIFRVREKRKDIRYLANVKWDPIAPGTCQADILSYDIQLQATDSNGTPQEQGRMQWGRYVVKNDEDLEEDFLKVQFRNISHPKRWYYRARVRAIDRAGRPGQWSPWTDPQNPQQDSNPGPPPPANIALLFDLNERDRWEPRWRAKVRFNEMGVWDVPPTNNRSRQESTLDGAIGANDEDIKLGSTSGWANPISPKLPLGFVIRPGGPNREICSYGVRDGNWLRQVKRGLEGTAKRAHSNGDKVVSPEADQQEVENDLDRYIIQLRRCNVDGGGNFLSWVVDAQGKFVQRQKSHSWKSEEDDGDNLVLAIFPNVRKKHWWRARVRTADRFGRKGEWTDWSNVGSPSDTTPPPQPNNVTVAIDNNKVHVDWDHEPDPDDPDLQHPDIAYYQVQLSSNSGFTNIVKRDMYQMPTKKTFKVKKASQQYWARVRSVDGSGNKSAWITSNANKQRPPQPTAPNNITFDDNEAEKGSKLRAIVHFSYNELGYDEDHIDRYVVQAIVTNTASYTGNETRRKQTVQGLGDEAEGDLNDPTTATFKGVPRYKWIRARIRAIDKNNRKSPWSLWSSSYQVADTTPPPAPSNVQIVDALKGIMVDWDGPTDSNDAEGDSASSTRNAAPDVVHYVVEVHLNSSFTNLATLANGKPARDRQVTATFRRFKGLATGGTYYARVRSISSTGTKSGWVTSTGRTTAAVVDRINIEDNAIDSTRLAPGAVTRPKIGGDAVGTNELDDTGGIVGTGTWRNSSGSTRVEISSASQNQVRFWHPSFSLPGFVFSGESSGLGYIALVPPHSNINEVPLLYLQGRNILAITPISPVEGELIHSGWQRGQCGIHIAASSVSANDTFGVGVSYPFGKLTSVPWALTFSGVGTDSNVNNVSYTDLTNRGFLFRAQASAGGTFLKASREYAAT